MIRSARVPSLVTSLCLTAAFTLAILPSSLSAQSGFEFSNPVGGIPDNAAGDIVIYNLPGAATTAPFDVLASSGGTFNASSFGFTAGLPGSDVALLSGVAVDTNLADAIGAAQNATFNGSDGSALTGYNDVGGNVYGYLGINISPGTDGPVSNGDGLFSAVAQAGAGVTGTFALTLGTDATFNGFGSSAGAIALANGAAKSVVVRESKVGDMNGDLSLNTGDIPGFVTFLSDELGGGTGYRDSRPYLQADFIGDANGDGSVNTGDIPAFVGIIEAGLGGGSPAAVPEPSSIVLALLGMVGGLFGLIRRRRNR